MLFRSYGEFLLNAQGEDVVAGIRTPQPISELALSMPKVYDEFVKIAQTLENHYRDMQDMEFTIENEKLFMLQTRNGKRTAAAALRVWGRGDQGQRAASDSIASDASAARPSAMPA